MGTFKSVAICFVLGVYLFNSVKLLSVQYDAFDNEILGWIVVSELYVFIGMKMLS